MFYNCFYKEVYSFNRINNNQEFILKYLCNVYKIKVLSVHWSKSRQISVAHVSSKVLNENTLNKIPLCMTV